MKNIFEQFIVRLKGISLDKQEKARMRGFLLEYMKANPVGIGVASPHLGQRAFRGFLSRLITSKAMPSALVLALLTGGTISYAAEGALPGDVLYPVKVKVNEEVRGWAAISPAAKAEWNTQVIGRRLGEAEKLVAEGRFSAEARVAIEENFVARAEGVRERIAELEAEDDFDGASDASSRFESSLAAHAEILSGLAVATGTANMEIQPVLEKVRERTKHAVELRRGAEIKLSFAASTTASVVAEGRLKAAEAKAEAKIEEARSFINRIKEKLGVGATARAEARLKLAEDTVAEGRVRMADGKDGDAFRLFQRAQRIAQEAKLFVSAQAILPSSLWLGVDSGSATTSFRSGLDDDDVEEIGASAATTSINRDDDERDGKKDDDGKKSNGIKSSGGIKIDSNVKSGSGKDDGRAKIRLDQ